MIAANKLRIHILIQCLALFSQHSGISWMHQIHLFIQPVIFFCTLDPSWAPNVVWVLLFAGGLDFLVLGSSGIVITRCIANPDPACVQQSLDQFQVTVVAALHVFLDILQVRNLTTLETRRCNNAKRMVVVSWFLFIQDTSWILLTSPTGIELAVLAHPVYNILVCWISGSKDPNKFLMVSGIALVLLVLDTYLFLTRDTTIATGFLLMYIFTDVLYAYFGYMAGSVKTDKGKK